MMKQDYPVIDNLKLEIEPHKKLWELYCDYDAKTKAWRSNEFRTLNADDVEADFRKFRSTST
jgi:hypothetical protein